MLYEFLDTITNTFKMDVILCRYQNYPNFGCIHVFLQAKIISYSRHSNDGRLVLQIQLKNIGE